MIPLSTPISYPDDPPGIHLWKAYFVPFKRPFTAHSAFPFHYPCGWVVEGEPNPQIQRVIIGDKSQNVTHARCKSRVKPLIYP